VKRSGNS